MNLSATPNPPQQTWKNAISILFAVAFSSLAVVGAAYGMRIAIAAGTF